MKTFILALLCLILPLNAYAVHVQSKPNHIDLDTKKVSYVRGEVTDAMAVEFMFTRASTALIPGDRVIIIDSPGGSVQAGVKILETMKEEQALGVRQVCVVVGDADSMAFNILTACDVRLAVSSAQLMFHKVALSEFPQGNERITAEWLRRLAQEMDRIDEPFIAANAKALHMTRLIYDKIASGGPMWSAQELLNRHYLDGIIKLK